jgi:PiT family inorganic phosphate transporter
MLFVFLIVAVGCVAFTNGANANFKGVASLYGSSTTSMRTAMIWGTLTTMAGSMVALFLAQGLFSKFSGKGLVSDELLESPLFTSAVASGAAITSFLATRFGFPVSTTHALVGGLLGAGLMGGGHVEIVALGKNFFYPLVLSPFLAVFVGGALYWLMRKFYLIPKSRSTTLDIAHFTSAGIASFARGLNDTPKMAALLLILPGFTVTYSLMFVALLIAFGAVVDSKNVAETLGKKVTSLTPSEGFAANIATAVLVTTASIHGLPASTTHVSVGSLLGVGVVTKQAKWRKVIEILVAWMTTVPCGAVFAAITYEVLRLIGFQN